MNSTGLIARRHKLVTRSLEINVTTHCNLRCYGCGRGSPAFAEEYLSVPRLADDLSVLSKVLHVREFKLAGGEPTQHPDLLEIIDVVRDSGIADQITLITNGVLLHQAHDELWKKIDKIWVSVYPGVKRRLSRPEIMSMGRKHRVKIRYRITDTFMRRVLNSENRDRELVRQIYSDCHQRSSCHSIHNGRYYKCASGPFIPKWLERIGLDAPDFSADGVPLHGNANLRQELEHYLISDEPLTACRYCLGSIGKSFANRQLNEDGVQEWLSENHADVRALIDPTRFSVGKTRGQRSFSGLD
jgi:organic radical activating enzyme